ncbi:hypothetical protein IGX29_16115 [Streptomyces sp. H28]|uniref:hypothetical protein n=1 Tax=Streptomyces sp. H28 TaxID=2775865 RepID=UPI00177C3538|nr:hypothetical protein [Streptomyces sp. H28]MBD9733296.1 hypothetical protein [Streptomyces sp. H28]
METIIVQLPDLMPSPRGGGPGRPGLLHLGPGDVVEFGRRLPGDGGVAIALDDAGVSRRAGQVEAAGDYWRLSHFSRTVSYAVENPEGAGEYLTVAPGRLGAPVPLCLETGEEGTPPADGGRTGAKRARLASVALRFGLVREEHLALLPRRSPGPGAVR